MYTAGRRVLRAAVRYGMTDLKRNKDITELRMTNINTATEKNEKVYSPEYINIPNMFSMPQHVGHCCTNVIRDHYCAIMYSNKNMDNNKNRNKNMTKNRENNNRNINNNKRTMTPMVMMVAYLVGKPRPSDMGGPIRYSSLTLEREEQSD
jgi:hypothetical protein